MSQKKILVVEDEKTSARVLKEMLTSHGYQADVAENGAIALQVYKTYQYPIVITDLNMPQMSGEELIQHLQKYTPTPVIFVETANSDPASIIEIMKMGVYDYLIKPINVTDLSLKIQHAFESAEIRRIHAISDRERVARLENQLDWYKWQERIKTRETKKLDKSLFHSLKTSFSQGAGFGSLITIVDLVISEARQENDYYCIDKDIFDLLSSNSKMAEKALSAFEDIDKLNSSELSMETVSYSDFHRLMQDCAGALAEKAKINNNIIRLSDAKTELASFNVSLNRDSLMSALSEVIINAFKFSDKNTDIIIISDRLGDFIEIEVLNIPSQNDDGYRGIPIECENLVFEPFFRMTKKIYESFQTLDFGIGLTFVENVIAKHKGRVSATTITDYSGAEKTAVQRVSLSILLPIIK